MDGWGTPITHFPLYGLQHSHTGVSRECQTCGYVFGVGGFDDHPVAKMHLRHTSITRPLCNTRFQASAALRGQPGTKSRALGDVGKGHGDHEQRDKRRDGSMQQTLTELVHRVSIIEGTWKGSMWFEGSL